MPRSTQEQPTPLRHGRRWRHRNKGGGGAYLVIGDIEFLRHLGDWKTDWGGNRENEQMKRARARKSKKQNPKARKNRIGAVIVRGVAYLRPRSLVYFGDYRLEKCIKMIVLDQILLFPFYHDCKILLLL